MEPMRTTSGEGAIEGSRGALMASEIAEQPGVLERILASSTAEVRSVARRVAAASPRFVLLAARGSSDHAALYAKYLIETRLGIPAGLVSTSTYTTYGASVHTEGALWIAISQSGASPDLVESTAAARHGGALTMAVTNAPTSPLAQTAEMHIDLQAGPELAAAATKTYTASLLSLWLLACHWGDLKTEAANALPDLAGEALALRDADGLVSRYRFATSLVTTSRGYAYATAREAALKFMETCSVPSLAFSGADLLHGPIAMIDSDHPVLVVLPEGAGGDALQPVIEQLMKRAADIRFVGTSPRRDIPCDLPVPGGQPEHLAPILQIMPLQQLAEGLSVARGHNRNRGVMVRGSRAGSEVLREDAAARAPRGRSLP